MPRAVDDDLLVHYLAGECSAKEEADIEVWLEADPANKRYFEEMAVLWHAAGRTPSGVRDVDRVWNRLKDRIRAVDAPPEAAKQRRSREHDYRAARKSTAHQSAVRSSTWRQVMRTGGIATVAMVVALIAVFLLDDVEPESDESVMREVATESGQRARVTLHDGTQVTLNAESRLTLPAQFADGERLVHLKGEAYFEVTPDEARPFKIRTDGAVTEVLGTKFNIGAYPDEPDVTVVVSEGKVAVRPDGDAEGQAVLLERYQLAQVSRQGERIVRREVDPEGYLAWTQGRLVFNDAPIQEVARKLRRWFGLQVELAPALQDIDRLNASFDEESAEEVLTIITETLGLRYERNGQRVTFLLAERR